MARPEKTGLDYFPMDVNVDDNLELIEAEHGVVGFGIVVKLWQKIYSQGYYVVWDNDTSLLFSRKNNTDQNLINSVVNSCISRGIFEKRLYKKYGIITSRGIQKRYVTACHQSKRKTISVFKEYNLLPTEFIKLITEETPLSPGESTQSKVKESKVKESKIKEAVGEKYFEIIKEWLDYKAQRKEAYKSDRSIKALCNKIKNLSGGNERIAKAIVEQSMANNWAGLFELKDDNRSDKPLRMKTRIIDEK